MKTSRVFSSFYNLYFPGIIRLWVKLIGKSGKIALFSTPNYLFESSFPLIPQSFQHIIRKFLHTNFFEKMGFYQILSRLLLELLIFLIPFLLGYF